MKPSKQLSTSGARKMYRLWLLEFIFRVESQLPGTIIALLEIHQTIISTDVSSIINYEL